MNYTLINPMILKALLLDSSDRDFANTGRVQNSNTIEDHFVDLTEMAEIGSGASRDCYEQRLTKISYCS